MRATSSIPWMKRTLPFAVPGVRGSTGRLSRSAAVLVEPAAVAVGGGTVDAAKQQQREVVVRPQRRGGDVLPADGMDVAVEGTVALKGRCCWRLPTAVGNSGGTLLEEGNSSQERGKGTMLFWLWKCAVMKRRGDSSAACWSKASTVKDCCFGSRPTHQKLS